MLEKNLKYYRLKKNMTKKALAEACGITPMAITNYESGKRKPEMSIVKRLAEILDVHVVDFLASRNEKIKFSHGEFRKKTILTKGEQEYVCEAVEEYFNRFFITTDYFIANPLPMEPKCGHLHISGDYEKDAITLRREFELPSKGPVEDIVSLLESNGFLVLFIEVNNDAFSGMSGFVNEFPYIAINANMNGMRKRTTIVHELAHLMFNWEGCSLDEEKYATQIAGAFLITKDDLFRELGQRRTKITKDMTLICEEYGVSIYLLAKRAAQVGILSTNAEKEFYIRANKAHWKTKEPDWCKKKEEPLLFKRLVFRAVNEEGLSKQKAAELLKMPITYVAEYCESVGV